MTQCRVADRVKETSTTTGTGDITLAGTVSQFQTFASRFDLYEPFYYAIVGQTGTEWEVGLGHLHMNTTTLMRIEVYESSNADALVNFSAGTKDVFCTIPAARIEKIFTKGQSVATAIGMHLT